jgi:hypothetical protein
LGKASTSAPTMLWKALLDQIKSYPNMIPSLAKAVSRYGSDLGWDVAMFMLLKTLSDREKPRVKEDGLHAADWLQGEVLVVTSENHCSMIPHPPSRFHFCRRFES